MSGVNFGNSSTMLMKWDQDEATLRTDSLLPTKRNRKCKYLPLMERKLAISKIVEEPEVLPTPGLKPIKAVELYTKWGPLIPEYARESTCPRPSDEVLATVRASKNDKVKARAARKRNLAAIEESKEESTQFVRTDVAGKGTLANTSTDFVRTDVVEGTIITNI